MSPLHKQNEVRSPQTVLLAILVEGGLAGLAWVLGQLLGQPPLATFTWDKADVIMGTVASVPMLAVFWMLLRCPVGSLANIRAFFEELLPRLFGKCTYTQIGVISLLAGVGEEMLFRGVLQGALSRWFGPAVGLAAASALFGLVHFLSLAYALMAGLMGIYLGVLWQVSGNILVPIVTHEVYDFLALVYLLRFGSRSAGCKGNTGKRQELI